jgi:hypothetical protein
MPRNTDSWLLNADANAYAKGLSDVLNEEASALGHSLFHYTTEAGLDGFLRTGELWGSSLAQMDDPGEVNLRWELINSVAARWSACSTKKCVESFDLCGSKAVVLACNGAELGQIAPSLAQTEEHSRGR